MVISLDKRPLHQEEILAIKEGLRRQGILLAASIKVEPVIPSRRALIRRTAPMDLCN